MFDALRKLKYGARVLLSRSGGEPETVTLHGGTAGLEDIDGIEDLAFHYVELLDALGLDEVVLGGVSLGGWIAAEFAVRWPERVRRLWICNAPGLWVDEE